MRIDATSGMLEWRPSQVFADTTRSVVVRVTDNGSPPASTTAAVEVTVLQHPLAPRLDGVSLLPAGLTLRWSTIAGETYRVQFKDHLHDPVWLDLGDDLVGDGLVASRQDFSSAGRPERYYRILLLEGRP